MKSSSLSTNSFNPHGTDATRVKAAAKAEKNPSQVSVLLDSFPQSQVQVANGIHDVSYERQQVSRMTSPDEQTYDLPPQQLSPVSAQPA